MKKYLKLKFIIPVALAALAIAVLGWWYFVPARPLDIAVLNQTVPASKVDKYHNSASDYRKHLGFFILLRQEKYKNPNTGKYYDFHTDYYGPHLEDGAVTDNQPLTRMQKVPDMVYLTDAYGDEQNPDTENKGVSYEDMSAVALARSKGAVITGESDIVSVGTPDSVKAELQSLFGVGFGSWKGRYIVDMKDLSDVPSWALSLHEQQYGRQWDYDGSGIMLVSGSGRLIVLEEAHDFNAGGALSVAVTDAYQKQFGSHKANFYNWFELVEADYGTDTVAEFRFNLNESGKVKFQEVSENLVFPAVTRKVKDGVPAYYMAGDFNDYVAGNDMPAMPIQVTVSKLFSYDRPGDVTNCFWKFYYPVMKGILKETRRLQQEKPVEEPVSSQPVSRIRENAFEVLVNGQWTKFEVKGFNVNGVAPGSQPYAYTRDYTYYQRLFDAAQEAGGNCIRAYDLMPPEFYRAIYENNQNPSKPKLYFFQSIVAPDSIAKGEYYSSASRELLAQNIRCTVDAVHGKASVPKMGSREGADYVVDVSSALLGYLVDMGGGEQALAAMNSGGETSYQGTYLSASGSAMESLLASLGDTVYTYQQETYGYLTPVGIVGEASLLTAAPWNQSALSYDPGGIQYTQAVADAFFTAFGLQPSDEALLSNEAGFSGYRDGQGEFPYGGYIKTVKSLQKKCPVLIDRVGLSTQTNAFEKETAVNGLTEEEQGTGVVRMLKAIAAEGYLGGLVSDLDDNWSACSQELSPYTVPLKDNPLWKNMLDPAQNTGLVAVEPKAPEGVGMSLKDTDRMQEMQLSADPAYLYVTVLLAKEVDYDTEQMMIGFDTYQRNNGEYLFDQAYYANSLSGMEFAVKFESKNTAALYVASSYNRNNGRYESAESYNGSWDFVTQLQYGNFETSSTHFFQTGSTVRIRIPWNLLNVTDPVQSLVVNDTRAQITGQIQTTATNGMLVSLLIANKGSRDTTYIFPESKEASGYKTFTWKLEEKPSYILRQKASVAVIARYFKP